MSLTQRLDIRQTQSLVMTPQLQQAIKLLQMSNQDLAAYVAEEIENNPLLERGDGSGEGGEELASFVPTEDEAPVPNPASEQPQPLSGEVATTEPPQSTEDVWDSDSYADTSHSQSTPDFDDEFSAVNNVAAGPSLREHLLEQIHIDISEPAELMIATSLLELLDDNGYLPADLDLVRAQLGATPAVFDSVIQKLQRLEPAGIFARSLPECLMIQLRERNRLDPAMQMLLQHLPLVARGERQQLMKLCGVDAEDLADMLKEIRALNPKPAQSFTADVAQPVLPDVLLRPKPGGGWQLDLNSETLPRVLVNERYHAEIQKGLREKADKDYVSERWQQANWLVKALHQRAQTILKVATEIVRQQDAFFVHGVQFLKPLVLRDIAAAVEMHESTVSRVTQHKYIATPRGLFELKYFFTSAIGTTGGAHLVSSEAVRDRIRALIEAEDPKKVLADEDIADLLRREGIDVARRTVAKYREGLNLPTSAVRRRLKRM